MDERATSGRRALPSAVLALALAGLSVGASAATSSGGFTVGAAVRQVCSVSATDVGFGNYTPGAGPLVANSTISVRCSTGVSYTLELDKGTTAGGNYNRRLMAYGAERLQYNLYTSAAFTTVLGDGTAGSAVYSGTGAGAGTPTTYTAFGRMLDNGANQGAAPNAAASTYSDAVTVTLTY